jgi:protein-tyrosine phosphatase
MATKEDPGRTGVLFVCLGNICRSPLAEAIFVHHARDRGVMDQFDVDSCGTGQWHVGERADPRAAKIAKKRGVDLNSIARQLSPRIDFERFHYIIAMDRENQRHLLDAGAPKDKVRLIRSFDPSYAGDEAEAPDVPDPFFGEGDGFLHVFDMLEQSCLGLMDELLAR